MLYVSDKLHQITRIKIGSLGISGVSTQILGLETEENITRKEYPYTKSLLGNIQS